MISELFFSVIAVTIWKPGLIYRNNLPPFLLNCYLYALQKYRTHSSKLRLLLILNLGGLHSMVTRPVYFLTWPIRVCASGQSIVRVQDLDRARHTRHKRAIIKKHLISVTSILHHSNKDTKRVQAFLVRSYNRSTQHVVHRSCLTRNLK